MASTIDGISVANYMTRDVKIAKGLQSIRDVIKMMYESDVGCLVIVSQLDPKRAIGIVTERDIMKFISMDQLSGPTSPKEISLLDMTVQSFMSKPVVTVPPNSTLWDVIQVMQHKNIRRLPVTNSASGHLVGIITEKDVMKAIARHRTIFCDLTERMPNSSSMIERIREIGLTESFFWPEDIDRPVGLI